MAQSSIQSHPWSLSTPLIRSSIRSSMVPKPSLLTLFRFSAMSFLLPRSMWRPSNPRQLMGSAWSSPRGLELCTKCFKSLQRLGQNLPIVYLLCQKQIHSQESHSRNSIRQLQWTSLASRGWIWKRQCFKPWIVYWNWKRNWVPTNCYRNERSLEDCKVEITREQEQILHLTPGHIFMDSDVCVSREDVASFAGQIRQCHTPQWCSLKLLGASEVFSANHDVKQKADSLHPREKSWFNYHNSLQRFKGLEFRGEEYQPEWSYAHYRTTSIWTIRDTDALSNYDHRLIDDVNEKQLLQQKESLGQSFFRKRWCNTYILSQGASKYLWLGSRASNWDDLYLGVFDSQITHFTNQHVELSKEFGIHSLAERRTVMFVFSFKRVKFEVEGNHQPHSFSMSRILVRFFSSSTSSTSQCTMF